MIGNGYKAIEIINPCECYIYRGGIQDLSVKKRYELHIWLNWIFMGEGYSHFRKNWIKREIPEYVVSLEGSKIMKKDDRLTIRVKTGDVIVLFKEFEFDLTELEG